jgi:hypothetical protein
MFAFSWQIALLLSIPEFCCASYASVVIGGAFKVSKLMQLKFELLQLLVGGENSIGHQPSITTQHPAKP